MDDGDGCGLGEARARRASGSVAVVASTWDGGMGWNVYLGRNIGWGQGRLVVEAPLKSIPR